MFKLSFFVQILYFSSVQDDEINHHSQLAEKLKEQMIDQEEVCVSFYKPSSFLRNVNRKLAFSALGVDATRLREDPGGALPAADGERAGQGGSEGGAAGAGGAGRQLRPEEPEGGGAGAGQPAAERRAAAQDGATTRL